MRLERAKGLEREHFLVASKVGVLFVFLGNIPIEHTDYIFSI